VPESHSTLNLVSSPKLSYSFFAKDYHQGAKVCCSGSKTFPFFEIRPIIVATKATKVKVIESGGPTGVNKAIVEFSAFKLIIELIVED
jgi:hypothetical protein